jgi:hypothetical protein
MDRLSFVMFRPFFFLHDAKLRLDSVIFLMKKVEREAGYFILQLLFKTEFHPLKIYILYNNNYSMV